MDIETCFICRRARSQTDDASQQAMKTVAISAAPPNLPRRLPYGSNNANNMQQSPPRGSYADFSQFTAQFDADRVVRANTPDALESTMDRMLRASPKMAQRAPPLQHPHQQHPQRSFSESWGGSSSSLAQKLSLDPRTHNNQRLSLPSSHYAPWPLSQAVPLVHEGGFDLLTGGGGGGALTTAAVGKIGGGGAIDAGPRGGEGYPPQYHDRRQHHSPAASSSGGSRPHTPGTPQSTYSSQRPTPRGGRPYTPVLY